MTRPFSIIDHPVQLVIRETVFDLNGREWRRWEPYVIMPNGRPISIGRPQPTQEDAENALAGALLAVVDDD